MEKKILIFGFGGLFMAIMAEWALSLPWTPIKLSLQSLSVSLLTVFFLKDSWYGVLGYLTAASLGWPVLAGGKADPWWFLSSKAGYCFGFLFAALIVSRLLEWKKPTGFAASWLCLSLNEGTILFTGWVFLSWHLSPQQAWTLGVLPFLLGAALKITLATLVWQKVQKRRLCQSIQNM